MSLDMYGHIDRCIESTTGTRYSESGSRDSDGIWIPGAGGSTTHSVTLQPLSEKEIDNLDKGGRRIIDSRRVYVNDGILSDLAPADQWQFVGVEGRFEISKDDVRPWRNYAKLIVIRMDDEPEQ